MRRLGGVSPQCDLWPKGQKQDRNDKVLARPPAAAAAVAAGDSLSPNQARTQNDPL